MENQRIRHALIIMVFGTFFGLLCSTLMNIALPTFMNVFHISEAQVQWVTNGYMLVNALMIPVSSFLIKRFPFKNLFHCLFWNFPHRDDCRSSSLEL